MMQEIEHELWKEFEEGIKQLEKRKKEINNFLKRRDIPKIYFAGKVRKNCWRHSIIKGLKAYDYWDAFGDGSNLEKRKYLIIENSKLIYTGPFFISCDHGCSHGSSTHGLNEDNPCVSNVIPKETVFNECMQQIEDADYIFCWLDDLTAYGTLFELGVAYEKNKKIFLAIDKKLKPRYDPTTCSCGNTGFHPEHIGKGCCHAPMNISDEFWFIKQATTSNYYVNVISAWFDFITFIKRKEVKGGDLK